VGSAAVACNGNDKQPAPGWGALEVVGRCRVGVDEGISIGRGKLRSIMKVNLIAAGAEAGTTPLTDTRPPS
jgi:hypothetical protein